MDVPTLLSKAVSLGKEGRMDEAITSCDQVLAAGDPKYAAEAWKTKALIYQAAKNESKTLGCMEQAANLGDKFAEKAAEMLRKEIQEAASKEQPAQAVDADALFNRGELLTNQGRPAEALACFEKALEINPQSAYTWYSRGVALGQLDRPQDEIASYDQALKVNPKFPEAWYNKAITLGNARQFREALTCFEKAKALDYADADQGISYCKKQLEATGSGVTAESTEWLQRGTDVIVNGGDPQEALDCFEKSLAINPHSERAWWGKGLQMDKLGRLEEALAAFDQALTIDPGNAAILMSKAAALYNAKQFQAAMGCYEKARELGDPTAVQGVISCRMMLGRPVTG
jgi:tetratricopeptide (TPR) repeat protein